MRPARSGTGCVDDEGAPRRFDTFRADALVGLLEKLQKDLLTRTDGETADAEPSSAGEPSPAEPAPSDEPTDPESTPEPASSGLSARGATVH